MDRDLRALQRALARFRRRRSQRYPAHLREQITAWVAERRRSGDWWCDISRPLGIPVQTLVRWAEPGSEGAMVVPVAIVDAPPAGTVTLVTPSGLRIEGVAVLDAIAILQVLA